MAIVLGTIHQLVEGMSADLDRRCVRQVSDIIGDTMSSQALTTAGLAISAGGENGSTLVSGFTGGAGAFTNGVVNNGGTSGVNAVPGLTRTTSPSAAARHQQRLFAFASPWPTEYGGLPMTTRMGLCFWRFTRRLFSGNIFSSISPFVSESWKVSVRTMPSKG